MKPPIPPAASPPPISLAPGEYRIEPTAAERALAPSGLRPLRIVLSEDEYSWPEYLRLAL